MFFVELEEALSLIVCQKMHRKADGCGAGSLGVGAQFDE